MVRKLTELKYTARRHDKAVIEHLLARPFNGVFSDPGTGKTGQSLAAFHVLRNRRLIDRLFVLGPINAVHESWPGQIEEWGFPYEMSVLHGRKKDELLESADSDIYGLNFDGLPWLAENYEALLLRHSRLRWWLMVDESHNMKDTSTRRFKCLKPLLPLFGRRTVLTGTPRPQDIEDLFGQAYIVDLGEALGKYITHYRREYFYPSGYGGYGWTPQDGAEKKIYKKLAGMFFRVDEKVLNLPPIHDVPVWVRLDEDMRKKYKEFEREFVLELQAGTVTAANGGVKSGKLRQLANGFVYAGEADARESIELHSEKVDAVRQIVDGLGGSPLLVGYEFTADGRRLSKALGGAPIVGDYSPTARRGLFADFNKGKLPAMVAQFGATSESLNLQEACHHVALYGLPWKAKDYIQFRKRVHRSGQKRAVTVHHILTRDTIDDRVMWPVLQRRNAEQADFFKFLMRAYGK